MEGESVFEETSCIKCLKCHETIMVHSDTIESLERFLKECIGHCKECEDRKEDPYEKRNINGRKIQEIELKW